jgi:serine/threonine-protein kinase
VTQTPTVPAPTQASGSATAAPTGTLATYENPTYGIRIEYPSDWTKQEQLAGTVVAFLAPRESGEDFVANVSILAQDLTAQPMTLDEYTNQTLGRIAQFVTDSVVLDSSAATLGGSPGHKAVFTGKQGTYGIQSMEVWTVKGDKAYLMLFVAAASRYPALLATAQEMIDSFEFTDQPG